MSGKRYHGFARFAALASLLLLIGSGTFFAYRQLASDDVDEDRYSRLLKNQRPTELDSAATSRIETFCGDCHALPKPDSFPRYAWHTEVRMGYEFYAKAGRTDLDPPPIQQTVAYYQSRAPEQLTFPVPAEASGELAATFEVETFPVTGDAAVTPAIAHLHWGRLQDGGHPVLIVSDMRQGTVGVADLQADGAPQRILATLKHPCHAEPCDLDKDGAIDLVVSDLGSFPPGDHDQGRVVWLRRQPDSESYEPQVIASGIGRVADARPADFDNDGDLDLIVAVFGMDLTGKIVLLRNVSESGEPGRFEMETIDPRPGAIHVPPCDLNGDGHIDFITVISQEYEQVLAFINQRGSPATRTAFHSQLLWEGPDLTFGSSGIQLVDLDADGDSDILYTNGDAFDNGFVNPSHGVQWLENRGDLEFAYHRLTDLTGAYAASAGDIDLDGDMDIIAVAWLPSDVEPTNVFDKPLASVVCLEQTTSGQFVRHTLEKDVPKHAALEMADFDNDGDLDFAVGTHTLARSKDLAHWLTVWWNRTKPGRQ